MATFTKGISEIASAGLNKKHKMPSNIKTQRMVATQKLTLFCSFGLNSLPRLIIINEAKKMFWDA